MKNRPSGGPSGGPSGEPSGNGGHAERESGPVSRWIQN